MVNTVADAQINLTVMAKIVRSMQSNMERSLGMGVPPTMPTGAGGIPWARGAIGIGAPGGAEDPDAADRLLRTWSEVSGSMQDATKNVKKFKKAKDKLDKNLKETAESVRGLAQRIVDMGGKLRSVSRLFFYASLDMMQFANVVLGPMKEGLALFEQYNKTMTQMWVNFQFLSQNGDEALALLDMRFKELAESTEFSRLEIAKAAAVFGTAGVAVEEISASLDEMASLARINFITMDQMAAITLRTMRRFRMSLEETTGEMWRLSAMAQMTGEGIINIANQMGYATEWGQQLGFTFQEIASHMTLLTETYGSASIAGRRLSNVYASLVMKGEEYGIQLRDMSGQMLESRDMIANLADYMDLIADPIEQNQYLMELFGKTGAASARTLLEAFKEGRLDKVMEDTGENMIDTMKDLSDTIKDELYVSIQDLRSGVQDLKLAIGKDLAPTIKDIIGPLTEAVLKFEQWILYNRELIVTLGVVAIGVTVLANAIKVIGFSIEIIVALAHAFVFLGKAASVVSLLMQFIGLTAMPALAGSFAAFVVGAGVFIAIVAAIIAVILFLIGFFTRLDENFKKAGKDLAILGSIFKIVTGFIHLLITALQIIVGLILAVGAAFVGLGIIVADFIGTSGPLYDLLGGVAHVLGWIAQSLYDVAGFFTEAGDAVIGFLQGFLPGSPTLEERILGVGAALKDTLVPMKDMVRWGGRLNAAVGDMNAEMTLGQGRATAGALMAGGVMGGQGLTQINVDAAYVQDVEELAEIIAERQIRLSKRHFRSTAY